MSEDFSLYRGFKERGESAAACWLIARDAGLDFFAAIRMLRGVFDLSLQEAKEVAVTADGRFTSLDEYQASLLPALKGAFKVLESETALASALPARSRWMLDGTPLDFEFTVALQGLRSLPDDVLRFDDGTWSDLLVFGEYDYAEGGGANPFLCVRAGDGSVCGLDVERDTAIFPLNSSVDGFVATFRMLDSHLAQGKPLPPDCASQLRTIDPGIDPDSDWIVLVESFSAIG